MRIQTIDLPVTNTFDTTTLISDIALNAMLPRGLTFSRTILDYLADIHKHPKFNLTQWIADINHGLVRADNPILTLGSARAIIGQLAATSKLPCDSFGLPACTCKAGSALAKISGSPCSECYALERGRYRQTGVKQAYMRRYALWQLIDREVWISAMLYILMFDAKVAETKHFRWFDSGDLQTLAMLVCIVEIALSLPNYKFWLPTQERSIVRAYKEQYDTPIPDNLVIRISSTRINDPQTNNITGLDSYVTSEASEANCRAFEHNSECGPCRKCWNRDIKRIGYWQH